MPSSSSSSLLLLLVWMSGCCIVAEESQQCTVEGECRLPKLDCGVYMAPSTLGEKTNMGIYTAKDLRKDQVINYPEIAIPLLFREWGEHKKGYDDGTLWDRYIWEGHVMELESYVETDREKCKAVFVPGVGCTVNSIMDMANIESTHGSKYDLAGLHRSKDPGTTAFSPYHSAITSTISDVPAGSELFANYGDYWIPDIPGVQVTLKRYMDPAETFLRNDYLPWIQQRPSLSKELKQSLWELLTNFSISNKVFSNFPAVPFGDIESYLEKQIKRKKKGQIVKYFTRLKGMRSLEWLETHGYCQDHLRPRNSTIPQAGRGAFAAKHLPAGTVVGYAPLVHLGFYGRDIFMIDYPDGRPPQQDLIINYSFGHRNSTVLLTPYGAMVNYINHDSKSPNVKVRWPNKELVAHKPSWLDQPVDFLRDVVDKIGLSFEYVALRDIPKGEEVTMDYGPEWEAAWDQYTKNWQQSDSSYAHSSAFLGQPFRTVREQEENPYPANLVTMCYESYTISVDGVYEWSHVLRPYHKRVYCNIIERCKPVEDEANATYTVQLLLSEEDSVLVHQAEQEGIFLYDRAYSQDWHLRDSFRFPIAIPDDVMPSSWLNGDPEHGGHGASQF